MAYIITRELGHQLFYLSHFEQDKRPKREWSLHKSNAVKFFYSREQIDRFVQNNMYDIIDHIEITWILTSPGIKITV